MSSKDIFICYAHDDLKKVKLIAQDLEKEGFSVFWDRKTPIGKTWHEHIESALDIAKCIVVVWSSNSVKSNWVHNEASEGLQRKILIPILIETTPIPLAFRSIQAASLVNWPDEAQDEYNDFVDAIRDLLEVGTVGESPLEKTVTKTAQKKALESRNEAEKKEVERKRIEAQKKLEEEKKQLEEEKNQEEEKKRIEAEKKAAERKRIEAEKQEAERKRIKAQKNREAKRKRIAATKKREEERKRIEAEEMKKQKENNGETIWIDDKTGYFIDPRDQHKYRVVKIGTQIWMAENLAYLPSVSPSFSDSDSSPYYYVYGYEGSSVSSAMATDNYQNYGVLYNWEAAKTVCPTGWHLPSDEEWKTLEKYLGMSSSDADDDGLRNSGDVGRKLKSISGWNDNGNGDNSSGFNAFPGGYRTCIGSFLSLGYNARFWSSSPDVSSNAWARNLYYNSDGVSWDSYLRRYGFSVRCLQK